MNRKDRLTVMHANLDEEAREFRREIDTAAAFLIASDTPKDRLRSYGNIKLDQWGGAIRAISVRANCELILRHIDEQDYKQIDRFTCLRDEAIELEEAYRARFSLYAVEDEAGDLVIMQAPQPAAPGQPAAVPVEVGRVERKERIALTDPQVAEIRAILSDYAVNNGTGKVTGAQMQEIARAYEVAYNTIQRIYYKKTHKDK